MHTVHKTVLVNMSEDFDREDDLQFFVQPYLFEPEYTEMDVLRYNTAPHGCVILSLTCVNND